jgi:hypothetical protein
MNQNENKIPIKIPTTHSNNNDEYEVRQVLTSHIMTLFFSSFIHSHAVDIGIATISVESTALNLNTDCVILKFVDL